ncbi:hypothetical protein C7431_11180 [Pantoea allii]|uniref:Uncharacterized protein n=1 Tax=Pantoea allii TaxID=574096 RepID=A0A2V2BD78_9GAMM|nr:hypothetical protein [Pantoea allii]PWK94343.1 hypothetical protein C7431_11180 [Pantoea allii]
MRQETLPFSAAVRMNEQDKEELRSMTGENPMYSESKIIRAAIRFFGAVSEDVRRDIIIASLNREDVRQVMRRHGIYAAENEEQRERG